VSQSLVARLALELVVPDFGHSQNSKAESPRLPSVRYASPCDLPYAFWDSFNRFGFFVSLFHFQSYSDVDGHLTARVSMLHLTSTVLTRRLTDACPSTSLQLNIFLNTYVLQVHLPVSQASFP
jgi:hypothetical protein